MDDKAGVDDYTLRDARAWEPPQCASARPRELVENLGQALAAVLYDHNQTLADRCFERIETRIAELVNIAAKRVVPKNIRGLIETVVVLRTARIEGEIGGLRVALAEAEGRLAAEIARAIETPFPEPAPEPKKPRRKAGRRRK